MTTTNSDDPEVRSAAAIFRRAPVTIALIAGSIIIALVSRFADDLRIITWLTVADLRGNDPGVVAGFAAIRRGEIWRLITPIFIHFGIIHLLFNMLWMKDLGPLIERRWSSRLLIGLVLVSAVISNTAQFVVDWDFRAGLRWGNALSGGMSGVVYALLGYLWIRGRFDPSAGQQVPGSVVVMMLGWQVVCLTGAIGFIANTAHAVGLVVGMAWAGITVAGRRAPGGPYRDPEDL